MVSGPEQSHNLPPWLQVQRPQSEPHDVHKSASQPADKQAPRFTSEPAQPEIRRTGGGKRRKVEPENTQASETLTPRIDASMPKPSTTTQRAHTNTTREERTGRVTAAAHAAVSTSSLEPVASGAHAVRSSSETKNNRTVRGDEAPTNTAPTSAASPSMASTSEVTEKTPQISLIRRRGRGRSAHSRSPRMMKNGHEVRMPRRSRLRLTRNSLRRNSLNPSSLSLCSRHQRKPRQYRRKVLLSSRPNPSRFPRYRSNHCRHSQSNSRKPNSLSKLRRSRKPRRLRRSRPRGSGRHLKRRRICPRVSIWHRLPRWIRRFW